MDYYDKQNNYLYDVLIDRKRPTRYAQTREESKKEIIYLRLAICTKNKQIKIQLI